MDDIEITQPKPFDLHDTICRYLGWPPYDKKPVVVERVTQVMTAEEYEAEFGFQKFSKKNEASLY